MPEYIELSGANIVRRFTAASDAAVALHKANVKKLITVGDGPFDPAYQTRSDSIDTAATPAVRTVTIADKPLVDVAAARKAAADALAAAKRNAVVAGISPAEMASWTIKRAEALAYQAKGASATNADAPNLAAEAAARNITTAALVTKVLNKAAALAALEAAIAGNCGKHTDAIDALAAAPGTSAAQIAAYDISTGWPA